MLDQVCGPVTGVNLEHMTPLMLPWTQDPWGEMRPPVSVEAMRMSAELAAATYHMEIERWLQAGWRDVTIQVDNDLLTPCLATAATFPGFQELTLPSFAPTYKRKVRVANGREA